MSLRDNGKSRTGVIESAAEFSEAVEARCRRAKELEEAGDYDGAARALGQFWKGVGLRPSLHTLDKVTQAALLLRVGVLTSLIGRAKGAENSLSMAKDLLSESSRRFESLGLGDRAAEAQTELGLCYRRAGSPEEASIYFQDALKKLESSNSILKGVILLRLAAAANQATRYHDALNYLTEAAPIFEESRDDQLLGRFNTSLGMTLKYLSESVNRELYLQRSLEAYRAAREHFRKAGNRRFLGFAENNLGLLSLVLEDFKTAHIHLHRARRIFQDLSDEGLTAEVDETRARVYLAQGNNIVAARVAGDAVEMQERLGDQLGELARALITRGKALARLGNKEWALSALRRAHETAVTAGDRECAGNANLVLIEELHANMTVGELQQCYTAADELLRASQHYGTLLRLRDCANIVVTRSHQATATSDFAPDGIISANKPINLKEEVKRYEGALVKRAMDLTENKVLRASRLLGLKSHQTLMATLKGRQAGLVPNYSPVPQRQSYTSGAGRKASKSRSAQR